MSTRVNSAKPTRNEEAAPTRDQILVAVTEVFTPAGFAGARVADIAERVDFDLRAQKPGRPSARLGGVTVPGEPSGRRHEAALGPADLHVTDPPSLPRDWTSPRW